MSEPRRYELDDFQDIQSWAHGCELKPSMLPPLGFIEPGLAVGFLSLTDSSIAVLDCLMTNPAAPRAEQVPAIVRIYDALMAAAKKRGYRVMLGRTGNPGVARMAVKRRGARISAETFFYQVL